MRPFLHRRPAEPDHNSTPLFASEFLRFQTRRFSGTWHCPAVKCVFGSVDGQRRKYGWWPSNQFAAKIRWVDERRRQFERWQLLHDNRARLYFHPLVPRGQVESGAPGGVVSDRIAVLVVRSGSVCIAFRIHSPHPCSYRRPSSNNRLVDICDVAHDEYQ